MSTREFEIVRAHRARNPLASLEACLAFMCCALSLLALAVSICNL